MALNTRESAACRNAALNARARLLDNGWLRIYSGAQPTDPDTAIGAQVLLASLRFSATSAPAAAGGTLTFNAITDDTNAAATGTAAWYRAFASDGVTAHIDGSVGTATSNLVLNSTAIQAGARVSTTSFVLSQPTQGT